MHEHKSRRNPSGFTARYKLFKLVYYEGFPTLIQAIAREKFIKTRSNKVTIYNRWGDEVFSVSNYNNDTHAFRGQNNKGNDLPSGTYFYKIEFNANRKMMTGYVTLRR